MTFCGLPVPMHTNAILHEAQQLYSMSDRLDSLAGQQPVCSFRDLDCFFEIEPDIVILKEVNNNRRCLRTSSCLFALSGSELH